ncbi:cubilin-like isoform X2 [Mercenaria mercenaria]|uniref:cubilin-like isoform X2 n=1 Tax=Mercenaria mercenaria TaxID=6596 RepID=UPI00234F61C4|nr:cubilin-like isoform X2 [Mercenaria mercenaria]
MGNRPLLTFVLKFYLLFIFFKETSQNTRNKRQIQPELPRILTQNGHLVFQTGTNHNITFRATNGGFVNVNGDNLAVITQTVKDNKLAIDQLRTAPTASSSIETRLSTIEGRLNNLQPTGAVQTQLLTLGHRIDLLQATLPTNIESRLSQIEAGLSNLQSTGEVANLINQLTSRIGTLETRVSSVENGNDLQQLLFRVSQLEDTVENLQTLLTTNECSSNPCRNGGTCVDTYNGFFCRCTDAFQGPNCDDDVNECSIYVGTDLGCQNGATCINTVGSFTCQCTANWHGVRCTESHDDCTGASSAELCGHGTCVNTPRVQPGQPKYTCICDDGWTNSGSDPACVADVNECTANRPPCSANPPVPCINLPGSFTCGSCPAGYSGNGFVCTDINECAVSNGGCSMSPMVQCTNTLGSRTCGPCPAGYQGDGVSCNWVGVCQDNNGGCHPQAACTESPGFEGRTCTCAPGYVGNGIGASGCVSQGPVTGPCGSTPCMNGAACQNVNDNGYRCVCQAGYTDQNCQTNINECASNPCQNGGSCTDRVNGYVCQCTESYTGSNCEVEQQVCGGYLTGESGTFRFPTVPGSQYPHDVSCAWRITTTYGKIVRVTFPQFNIEPHPNCNYDFLQINDGPTAASYAIGRYCGDAAPNNGQPINSTHHQMYFWFRSDVSVASDGFTVQWTSALPVCGGNLAGADHGEISSPGYPGNYPHDRDCVWTITVSPGNNIMFTFATLDLEVHPDCNYDYLEIRDGGLDSSPVLRRYCNTSSPAPLSTTGPTAWVKFHSDSSVNTGNGFHITYAAVAADAGCGGTFTDESGILISPNYPNPYNHDAQCVWIVRVNERDTISLTFTNMDLEGHADCQYDYIEVRDGSNQNAPLMGRYCGDAMPVPLTTTQNVLYVRFVSDASVTRAGFRATWQVSCGGIFTSPTGIIRSPYFPDAYPSNRQCEYFINQSPGNRVTLTFTTFDIEGGLSGGDCAYDFLEIRDGGSSNSPVIGTYCGPQVPDPQTTSGNLMYLKFVTDGSVQNLGFEATYAVGEGGCGGPLTDDMGSIQSPGHPNLYPHGVNCTWNIQVQPGLVVRLTFHTFSIESHSNCNYDSVALFDGATPAESDLIGRYCGSSMPPVATSTNNMMTVQFISDASVATEGFSASYVALNASTLCGSAYTDLTGVITSPNFPDGYPHQRECTWTITAPEGNQILINVTDFNLENHPNCNYDYLEIRNGGYGSSPLVGKYCGTTIDRIIVSHSNRMYIKLVTDQSLSAPGFRLSYDSTATGCGADLTTPTGSFVSPNYPMPYGHNAECFYTITVSRGSRVQLTFVDIEIEVHPNCNYDYVEVRDGSSNGALLGKFCGTSNPDPVTSSSNVMWVKYRTDYSVSGRGFHAFYISLCSGTLTGFSGVIESPNFPNPYPHNRNCTWIIEASQGNTVNVTFSHFNIEAHPNCQYDYLQINDGGYETSNSLGTFCGINLPPPLASTQERLWLKFVSDYSVAPAGFRLEYITDGCGGYLRNPTGSFTSPNYPNPYPHRRTCEWTIVADTGSYIQLTIETFDLEFHSSCAFDGLEIYGGPDDSAPRLAHLCAPQQNPQVLSTTGNMMFVRFRSDISVNGNGFSATYKTNTGGCGGNFSTTSGTIVSKNYPNNYPHNTDCEWLITVDDKHTVELTFVDFDVESASDCRFDYVAVYDGSNVNATELLNFCGATLPSPVMYRSSGNQMYIRMRTDVSVSARGFKADFVTGCGGVINTEDGDGDIVSPGYPDTYRRGSNCSWLIMAEHATDRITLTFTHMDLEESNDCNKDYVLVLDGNNDQAPQINKLCGRVSPSAITSQGSALFVQFVSDMSYQATGFRATYTKSSSACGGDYTSQHGSFTSPGYPNNYPINTECVWTVSVAPGNRVQLSFSFFNMEVHDNCNYDYLELHEGELGGPLLGRFCGNDIPSNLTAYNGLWIKFRSDDSATGQGFIASYSAVFGGELTGNSGQIASPLYPYQYPHNADYMWTVTVPTNMRVRVTFTTLDMESSWRGCSFDFLKIRDGGTVDSPVVGTYCGTTLPDMYISTSNQLHVEFHSDWSSTGQGFLLNWEATSDNPITTPAPTASTTPVPGCGGILNVTDSLQTVISPGYPDGYQHNLDCTWILNSPVGSRIWLNITDINIEAHSSCSYDILKIYNSGYTYGRLLGTFCGRTGNEIPLISSQNSVAMKFTTDFSVNGTGFSLQYKKVCGGVMRVNNGVIQSDRYPNNYPANANCTWTVTVPAGRTIRLQFNNNFNIQGTQGSCSRDYLQLLNGLYSSSPPLGNTDGRYCGNTAPATMETDSNRLNVQFVSDGSGSGPGFSLSFSEVHVTCGGQLSLDASTTSGTFTSPNYPNNYPHNVDCVWLITAPAHERIQIDFIEDFGIERHSRCNFDFIEMRDGGTVNSLSLGKFCGYSKPSTVVSTGNVMYVRFRTDSSVPRIGFKAQYKIATCGGRYVGNSGTITSPNYPGNYDNNAECIWIIQGPEGHFLTFTFTAFTLQYSSNCSFNDFVEIRDLNSTGPVLSQVCGSRIPNPVMTSDRYGYVRFVSNEARQYPGFSLNFEASVEVCGGDLTTPEGSFQSPNFPGNYPHSRICEWKISVQPGRRITFTFDPFNIENHSYCRYDYVAVYNGRESDSPIIGRYCGDNPPAMVETSGNTARVVFRTDGSVTNGGFRASYTSQNEAACGGLITSSPGNITSPGFGTGNYSNNLQCIWTIRNQAYINTSIVIRFNTLKLEPATSCRFDWLEAREGDSLNGVLLDEYCGNNTLPAPIISPTPSVWLRFRTDRSIVDQGFHLSYNFTQCGGMLTDPTGIITSPNYPSDYDHNDACAWMITAPEGTQIVLEFTDIDIETHPNCNYDYLEVFNGPYASSPSIGRFCGSTTPATIRSQSNSLRLVHFTDFSMAARGFRLTYSFRTQGCGGIFHSPEGNLSTPNYPRSYPHNTECVWDINVDSGYTITLTFNPPFDMEHHGACDYDYVEVSDVLSNGTLVSLGKWCENILPPVATSTGNRLIVKFRSDQSTNGNGFSAGWTSGCGGVLTSRQGILLSPGFPNTYTNNLRCNYTLNMDPQHFILLRFDPDNFNIETGRNCGYDWVAVYAGNNSNSRLLGKYCGTTAPQPVSSLGQMHIQFWTDGSVVRTGYRAHYMVNECGGVFTEPYGIIETPNGPTDYHNNHNCTWSITVVPNRVIQLKFQMFDLEAHSTCNYDYLDIYDGPSLTSPLIGRYCGDVMPTEQIRTTSNTMTINFITDFSVTRAGFRAAYRTTYGESHGCGGILNSTSGTLRAVDSDGDGQYENDLDCRWSIIAANNKVIRLTFTGLDMEDNPTCHYDYLKIYDGMTEEDPLIGTYCGSNIPPMITSTSNVLYVRFYSDVSVTGAGFNATYTQLDGVCGGTYTSTSSQQVITSPGYPNAFRQDVRCRWTIDAQTDTDQVELNVTALNLQTTSGCSPEYLEFRDYPLGSQGRVVHACGVTPPSVFISVGQTVQINYAATSGGSTGFSISYRTATCNRTYTGVSGQIYSPGWPGRYPHNANCQFQIQAASGTTVSLYFNAFHIEPHTDCNYDYLEVRNGSDPTSPTIRRICGWALPDPVFATTNSVGFSFITDQSVTYPGYDITYTATSQGVGCGGNITGINGSFTSPSYPGNYTLASTCTWLIQVPPRRVITLTFTDMRNGENCGTDYIVVYDGNSDLTNQFGRYCGGEVPAAMTTSSNVAYVKYVSDGSGSAIAFRLTFTS